MIGAAYDRVMRMRRSAAVLLAAIAVGVVPAVADATTYAPPGKAGSSEYAETLPASGGNVAPPTGTKPVTGAALSKLGAGGAGAKQLARLGKAGQSAAAFARATAPAVASHPRLTTGPGAGSGQAVNASEAGGSAFSGLLHLVGGSDVDGIGIFLPLLLAFSLGAAAAVGALRLRRTRHAA
jgi:hypothetical protein